MKLPASKRAAVLALMVMGTSGCREAVVDSRAFAEDARLDWLTVMPSSRNTALWLAYRVLAPVARSTTEAEGIPEYDFGGRLSVMADGAPVYTGAMFLAPTGLALDKTYSQGVRKDVERIFTYSDCKETGRMKLLQLRDVPSGARLQIEAELWNPSGEDQILGLVMQLGPN